MLETVTLSSSARALPMLAAWPDRESAMWPRFHSTYAASGRRGLRKELNVLVVEDDYIIMMDLCAALRAEGARIVGQCGSLADSWDFVGSGGTIDLAVLDINLRGEKVYPVADALLRRGARIAFVTGYDCSALPSRFADVPCFEKPLAFTSVIKILKTD
jgi:CheY-like chemotaxis protein